MNDDEMNYCAFSKNHRCVKYMDYMLTRFELQDIDQMCHGNWIEIERKYAYIKLLEEALQLNGIPLPDAP